MRRNALPGEAQVEGPDEQLWSAIGDPTRRQVLDLLLSRGATTSTALAALLPVSRQAVAKHLNVLADAGLVEGQRVGREVRYRVRQERLDVAVRAMADVAAAWDRRLRTIKAIAESRTRGNR